MQQEIDQDAQVCPHCKMPQSLWAYLKLYIPFVLAFAVVILLINIITDWYNKNDEVVNQD